MRVQGQTWPEQTEIPDDLPNTADAKRAISNLHPWAAKKIMAEGYEVGLGGPYDTMQDIICRCGPVHHMAWDAEGNLVLCRIEHPTQPAESAQMFIKPGVVCRVR